jgi:hypothetical protein
VIQVGAVACHLNRDYKLGFREPASALESEYASRVPVDHGTVVSRTALYRFGACGATLFAYPGVIEFVAVHPLRVGVDR